MTSKKTASIALPLLIAVAGCAPTPRIELTSAQVSEAFRASLDENKRQTQSSASRIEAHLAWLQQNDVRPIDEASDREKELARAVVRIMAATGTKGTGFFVSPDGLLLTNEHVVPKSTCSRERCAGYEFVRGFSAGGDFEIFTRARAVAFSDRAGADFALLQIELPPGREVPYLQLEFDSPESILAQGARDGTLRLIAHPFGSPARSLPAVPTGFASETSARYRSLGAPGTSGGPIVDLKTGRAVILNTQIMPDPADDVAADGSLRRMTNKGTLSNEIVRRLRLAFPELAAKNQLLGSDFASWMSSAADRRMLALTTTGSEIPETAPGLAEFLLSPAERRALRISEAADGPDTFGFFHHFYGTRYAESRWAELLEELISRDLPTTFATLEGMLGAHQVTGTPIPMTQEQATSLINRLLSKRAQPAAVRLLTLRLGRALGLDVSVDNQAFDCAARVVQETENTYERSLLLASVCGSRELPLVDGKRANTLELLLAELRASGDTWNDDLQTATAYNLLYQIAFAAPWSGDELETAKEATRILMERSPTWSTISDLNAFGLRLKRAPETIGPGGLAGLFDGAALPPEETVQSDLGRLREALKLPAPEPITPTAN